MRVLAGLTAAAALLGAPLAAQDSPGSNQAFTPEEDLDCAIYIGAILGENPEELTPDSQVALTSALTYFIGRYEAQRGQRFAQAMIDRFPDYEKRDPREVEQTCSLRARGLGSRMQAAGRALIEQGSASERSPQG